jgi:hypothetical protein
MRDLRQHFQIGRDDQLGIAFGVRLAHAVSLPGPYEHHLVGIPDDVIPTDVPHKEAAIGRAHLKIVAKAFGSFVRSHALAAQVFDQTDGQVQKAGA